MYKINANFLCSLFLHSIIIYTLLNLNLILKDKKLKQTAIQISFSNLSNFKNELPKKRNEEEIKKKIKNENILAKKNSPIDKDKKQLKKKLDIKNREKEIVLKKTEEEILNNQLVKQEFKNIKNKKNEVEQDISKKQKSDTSKDFEILDLQIDTLKDKEFDSYKSKLRYLIQEEAIRNYPRRSMRKKEEGLVELVFTLKIDGSLEKVTLGNNTKASDKLIESSLKTLKKLSPFEKNDILKKRNKFIIKILYKVN